MVKKHEYSVSVELRSKLMKKPKNKYSTLTWSANVIKRKRDHGFPVISRDGKVKCRMCSMRRISM